MVAGRFFYLEDGNSIKIENIKAGMLIYYSDKDSWGSTTYTSTIYRVIIEPRFDAITNEYDIRVIPITHPQFKDEFDHGNIIDLYNITGLYRINSKEYEYLTRIITSYIDCDYDIFQKELIQLERQQSKRDVIIYTKDNYLYFESKSHTAKIPCLYLNAQIEETPFDFEAFFYFFFIQENKATILEFHDGTTNLEYRFEKSGSVLVIRVSHFINDNGKKYPFHKLHSRVTIPPVDCSKQIIINHLNTLNINTREITVDDYVGDIGRIAVFDENLEKIACIKFQTITWGGITIPIENREVLKAVSRFIKKYEEVTYNE